MKRSDIHPLPDYFDRYIQLVDDVELGEAFRISLDELAGFEVLAVAPRISCPTLLTAAEGDPTAASGAALLAALTVARKERIVFTAAEGAGGHCEAFNRALYHQRVFDWLDETLGLAC